MEVAEQPEQLQPQHDTGTLSPPQQPPPPPQQPSAQLPGRHHLLDPLSLLDAHLAALHPQPTTAHPAGPTSTEVTHARQLEVLRVASFLFEGGGGEEQPGGAHDQLLERAIEVLDRGRLVQHTAKGSGRAVWTVHTGRGNAKPYVCLGGHYCSCYSFAELSRHSSALTPCKHLLALRLAPHVGRLTRVEVDDAQLHTLINNGINA